MKRFVTIVLAVAMCAALVGVAAASNPVRISQVYAGGGNTSAPFLRDYVELFNSGQTPVTLTGWSLQYGSSTGTVNLGACTNCLFVFPAATIQPCGYYLVALAQGTGCGGGGCGVALTTPDATGLINMGASAGKIGLKPDAITTPFTPGGSPPASLVDEVGWGTSANLYETSAAGGLSNTAAAVRKLGGMQDTDNNLNDFVVTDPIPAPPRSTLSPPNPLCGGACCLRHVLPGSCIWVPSAECAAQGGIWLGAGVPCDPVPCVTPATPSTWGKIKSIYR